MLNVETRPNHSSNPSSLGKIRPFDIQYLENPTQNELRALTLKHTPSVIQTKQGSIVKVSRNKNRVAKFTYLIATADEAKNYSMQAIDPAKAADLIQRQAEYIRNREVMIAIDGYLGLGEPGKRAFGVEWLYTLEGANIAGMQQTLSFSREQVEGPNFKTKAFQPNFRVVYTPDFFVDDMPGRQAVLVDLKKWTTYIMGPDYFGESKKGALRMLNNYVMQQGGMVLHAGAKAVHLAGGKQLTMTIMGESGTGKTTTTFSKQGDLTQPIQDDMVAIWPKGEMSITENGCFAKTEGLTAESEPVIYYSSLDSRSWLENVYVNRKTGEVDFLKGKLTPEEVGSYRQELVATNNKAENVDKYIKGEVKFEEIVGENGIPKDGWDFVVWTQNGRSIVPMSAIKNAADLRSIPAVQSMGILNRDDGPDAATPGLVKFVSPAQAAGFFMLGETSKTSAAGKERGKMRSPFTQPFFPGNHQQQARRFRELAATTTGVDMWMMNTGNIAGQVKVKIPHSSAMLEAMLSRNVKWIKDEDFGYEVVDVDAPENAELLKKVPVEVLQPKKFYEKTGRMEEYRTWVSQMKSERRTFLEKYQVDKDIIEATTS